MLFGGLILAFDREALAGGTLVVACGVFIGGLGHGHLFAHRLCDRTPQAASLSRDELLRIIRRVEIRCMWWAAICGALVTAAGIFAIVRPDDDMKGAWKLLLMGPVMVSVCIRYLVAPPRRDPTTLIPSNLPPTR